MYPISTLYFSNPTKAIHPTQKPVDLLQYIISTYTKPDQTVLDFTMGSGSTGVAAVTLNRRFIGVEINDKYFTSARYRINNSHKQMKKDMDRCKGK